MVEDDSKLCRTGSKTYPITSFRMQGREMAFLLSKEGDPRAGKRVEFTPRLMEVVTATMWSGYVFQVEVYVDNRGFKVTTIEDVLFA